MEIQVADIQVGSTIVIIGATQNNILTVTEIEPEQWGNVAFAGISPEGREINYRLFASRLVRVVG